MDTQLLKRFEISREESTGNSLSIYPKLDIDYDKYAIVKEEVAKLNELEKRLEKIEELTEEYNSQVNQIIKEKDLLLRSQIDLEFEEYNNKSLELIKKIEDTKVKLTTNQTLKEEVQLKVREVKEQLQEAKTNVRGEVFNEQLTEGKKEVIEYFKAMINLQEKAQALLIRMLCIGQIEYYGRMFTETAYSFRRSWNDNRDSLNDLVDEIERRFSINKEDL